MIFFILLLPHQQKSSCHTIAMDSSKENLSFCYNSKDGTSSITALLCRRTRRLKSGEDNVRLASRETFTANSFCSEIDRLKITRSPTRSLTPSPFSSVQSRIWKQNSYISKTGSIVSIFPHSPLNQITFPCCGSFGSVAMRFSISSAKLFITTL